MSKSEQDVEADVGVDVEAAERLQVRLWRFEQFIGLGFSESASATLAEAHVDLSLVRRMVAAGCPPETASRIVL
jgi:hypothetical protein